MNNVKTVFLISLIFVMTSCQSKELVKGVRPSEFYSDSSVVKLVLAASRGDTKHIDKLVAGGVDVNSVGKDGFTPLLGALIKRNKKGVARLLKYGANPNAIITGGSLSGQSAIWIAAGMENPYFLDIMLKHGGNPNYQNSKWHGDTLLYAAIFGHHENAIDRVKILIDAGADINARGANGYTPLIQAAVINQYRIIYYLLEAGADYKITSTTKLSLISLVERGSVVPRIDRGEYWRDKVVEFLRSKGEDITLKGN